MSLETLIKRINYVIDNPEAFTEEMRKVLKGLEHRKDVAYFDDETNLKETKFAIETLFDKELSQGRKHDV